MKRRPGNPVIPGNTRDRTGSAGILRRAMANIRRRYAGLQAEVLAIFARVPVYSLNDAALDRVLYGLTPDQLQALSLELLAALDRWIASGRETARAFWWSPYPAEAAQLGTAQSVANLAQLSAGYAAARNLETVVFSAPYRNRVAIAQIRSYEHWTGLAAEQKSKLTQIIGRAVVDGKNPKAARTEIMESLDVSRSRAATYAQTDITNTLREARMAESDYARDELGVATGLLWTSALIPTTRPWHASRSGKVFDSDEVRAFYEQKGNRYRCHCSITETLLDDTGKPILTDNLKRKMRAEREAWEREALNN